MAAISSCKVIDTYSQLPPVVMMRKVAEIRLFDIRVCIVLAISLTLMIWASHKMASQQMARDNFFQALKEPDFPLDEDHNASTIILMIERGDFNLSRFASPWYFDNLILTNRSNEFEEVMEELDDMSIEVSKKIFYNLLKDYDFYQPLFTAVERQILLETLSVLADTCMEEGIEYFLCADTLVGSYRHQGLVPWTGSAHVCLDSADWARTATVLSQVHGFRLSLFRNKRWRFHAHVFATNQTKPFPFVELSFYRQDYAHVWSVQSNVMKKFMYKKCDFFPLSLKPFHNTSMFVPANTEQVVLDHYGNVSRDCHSYNYNFLGTASISEDKYINLPCRFLHSVYPFVFRSKDSNRLTTTLALGSKILNTRTKHFEIH